MIAKLNIKKLLGFFLIALTALSLGACTRLMGEPNIGVSRTGEQTSSSATPNTSTASTPSSSTSQSGEHQRIINSYGGVYNNRKAQIMVANVSSKLLLAARQGNSKFTVTILDSPDVNAFALPGGFIYVTRGLLALANDESELAAVLSHEIAHVILRHARARSDRTRTSQIVDKVINSVLGGDSETDQTAARSRLSLAAFSQSQELAADKEGILIAGRTGYDPHAAARLLNSMQRQTVLASGQQENLDDFLASHPSTPDRIERAIKSARSFGAPGIGKVGRRSYLSAISGLRFGPSPNQGVIIGQKFVQPTLKFTFSVPKEYKLQYSQSAIVAVANNGAALRFDSAKVPKTMSLANYLRSGWIAGLKPETVQKDKQGNIEMAYGEAQTSQWVFRVSVVRFEGEVYRFIFAAKNDSTKFENGAKNTLQSFRRAGNKDIAQIKNSSIALVTAKSGDRISNLVNKMANINNANSVFLVLNDLYQDDPLIIGQQYKIIKVE